MFQQELHHFHSVLLTGNVERGETVLHRETALSGCLLEFRGSTHTQESPRRDWLDPKKGEVNELSGNKGAVQERVSGKRDSSSNGC